MRTQLLAIVAGLVLAAGAATAAAAPPSAMTGPVSAVGPTTATLTGTVNPNGSATTWYFEYGTSTSYGTKTAAKSAGSGTTSSNVSSPLTSLEAGVTYHYRIVATSGAGTTRGSDGLFTTTGAAPGVIASAAAAVTLTSATLSGTVDPNGRATTWFFEYGTSKSYGTKTALESAGSGTSPVKVSVPVSNLKPGVTYHFRLVATNDAGTGRTADQAFVTTSAPAVVTRPASGVSAGAATFNGAVNPNGRSTTWYFEYGTTTSYGSKSPARSAGSGLSDRSVSASVTNLAVGTTYHFRLVATNSAGTNRGADATVTTAGLTMTASGLQVVHGRGITLSGVVTTGLAGERVTVLAQRFGEGSFSPVATVLSAAGGLWSYLAKPTIGTSYQATWKQATTAPTSIGVRPAVSFRVITGGRFSTRVVGARSFAARTVKFQRRLSGGRWKTVRYARLNASSVAIFRATLPRGTSSLRVVMSVNQAGAGYLAGISRTIVFHR